jgi:hypothetical protein
MFTQLNLSVTSDLYAEFELNSKTPIACQETGLKEVVQCNKTGRAYRR